MHEASRAYIVLQLRRLALCVLREATRQIVRMSDRDLENMVWAVASLQHSLGLTNSKSNHHSGPPAPLPLRTDSPHSLSSLSEDVQIIKSFLDAAISVSSGRLDRAVGSYRDEMTKGQRARYNTRDPFAPKDVRRDMTSLLRSFARLGCVLSLLDAQCSFRSD